jgi:hypothetical protein
MRPLIPCTVGIVLVTMLLSSCCTNDPTTNELAKDVWDNSSTKALWENTNPNDHIWIPASAITEADLIRKRVSYRKCDEESLDLHGYLVKKSAIRKFGDYTVRTLATPVTVTVDGTVVVVCIFVMLHMTPQ